MNPPTEISLERTQLLLFHGAAEQSAWLALNPTSRILARVVWPREHVGQLACLVRTHGSAAEARQAAQDQELERLHRQRCYTEDALDRSDSARIRRQSEAAVL